MDTEANSPEAKEIKKLTKMLSLETEKRKHAEEELHQQLDLLSMTISAINEAIIITDTKAKVSRMNSMAEQVTKWKAKSAEGKVINMLFKLENKLQKNEVKNPVFELLENKNNKPTILDCILKDKEGNEHIINGSVSVILNFNKEILGTIFIFRDVTQQIKLEEENNRNKNIQSLGNLASGIAHDFNNYLAGILGNLNLMKLQNNLGIELQTLIDSAERATKGARKLALQLLSFAKGGNSLQINADVKQLITQRTEEIFAKSIYEITITMEGTVWPLKIDTAQLEQVISNILHNSREAMPDGGKISIHIENTELNEASVQSLKKGSYVKISIKDTGCGINHEHKDKIFMPYFSTKKSKSGLGLTTSYSIIQKHQGLISVKSGIGKGCTAVLYIPAQIMRKKKTTEKESDRPKILYMDDNELLLQVTKKMIYSLGFEAVCVTDGTKALDLFSKAFKSNDKFLAVIMDLTIPGGSGAKEIIKDLRKIDPDIYTIISSGYTTNKAITEYKSFGFDAVVTKPFTIDDLRDVLLKRE